MLDATSVTERTIGRHKFGFLLVMAVILFLAVAACSSDEIPVDFALEDIDRSPETPIVIPLGEPLVIGVSSALTGPAAPRGQEYRDAVVMAVEQWKTQNGPMIGGHQIMVVSEDDGCTESDVTRLAAERLLKQPGLVGVLGPNAQPGPLELK